MGATTVTIAVVSWNTRDLLARALRSLQPDVDAGLAEVWVVDNASSDGSADLVRDEFPWAKLVANAENVGFGRAVNQVASQTSSEWLACANADVALINAQNDYATAIQMLKEIVDSAPGTRAARTAMLYLGDSFGAQGKPAEAVNWYRRSAEKGFAGGQFNLGRMYAAGRGTRQSDQEAYKWFSLASAQGHPDARKQLAEVAKRLTAEQIAQAKQGAQETKSR